MLNLAITEMEAWTVKANYGIFWNSCMLLEVLTMVSL